VSNHDLTRFIRFVSRFTVHLCNAIFFRLYLIHHAGDLQKNCNFEGLDLNKALVRVWLDEKVEC